LELAPLLEPTPPPPELTDLPDAVELPDNEPSEPEASPWATPTPAPIDIDKDVLPSSFAPQPTPPPAPALTPAPPPAERKAGRARNLGVFTPSPVSVVAVRAPTGPAAMVRLFTRMEQRGESGGMQARRGVRASLAPTHPGAVERPSTELAPPATELPTPTS